MIITIRKINDIKQDAFYLINKFNKDGLGIKNFKLQKLMYFFEAFYMNVCGVDRIYEDEFYTGLLGPIQYELLEYFRKFKGNEIKLTPEEIKLGQKIDKKKKKYLGYCYEIFSEIDAIDLAELSMMDGSPWDKLWTKNDGNVVTTDYISKVETKKWFRQKYMKKESD